MLSLIVGLVAPTIVGSMKRSQLKKITDDLVGAIRYTRSQAMIKNKAQRIIFDLKESRYVIPEKEKVVQVPKHLNINLLTAESERQGNTSGAIRFYPDGSSTGGRVTLTEKDKRWVVHVAWLTGKVKLVRYNIDGENE
jgi:general secretion pathway protein H